jgi:hypothetical protein
MVEVVWSIIKDPNNRAVLEWIGGGAVVVAGGIWVVIKFLLKKDGVSARDHSIAVGGNATNSPMNINNSPSSGKS